jgi:hypothetical protein
MLPSLYGQQARSFMLGDCRTIVSFAFLEGLSRDGISALTGKAMTLSAPLGVKF